MCGKPEEWGPIRGQGPLIEAAPEGEGMVDFLELEVQGKQHDLQGQEDVHRGRR